jgi:hypothetical protein
MPEPLRKNMDKILTNNSWSTISSQIPKHSPKFAAIAYVSKNSPLEFGDGDVLICNASAAAISNGNTDARTLLTFKKNGARIFSCENLHAKVVVCGKFAIVGSSNLSKSSEEDLLEATLITDRRQIRAQVLSLIYNLIRVSNEQDVGSISKLTELPVVKHFRQAHSMKVVATDFGTSYWVISTVPMEVTNAEIPFVEEGERKAIELTESKDSDVGWIRWVGKSAFRRDAKPGDVIVEISKEGRTTSVIEPRPILYRQDHDNWTRFYVELREDLQEMSWRNFERNLKKIGIQNIVKNSTKKLSTRDSALVDTIWET